MLWQQKLKADEEGRIAELGDVPFRALRENRLEELDFKGKAIGVVGARFLSLLLPSAMALTKLGCAAAPVQLTQHTYSLFRQRPLTFLNFSCASPRSLNANQLCGVNYMGEGTYTVEGINKLCESLKTSSITSLRCALPLFPC